MLISPAMHSDRTVLSKLLLGLVDLPNEVNEPIPRLRHPLFRPVNELELPKGAWAAVSRICHLELSQYVLGHVVLCNRIHHKTLVADRSLAWPVLVTFLLHHLETISNNSDKYLIYCISIKINVGLFVNLFV